MSDSRSRRVRHFFSPLVAVAIAAALTLASSDVASAQVVIADPATQKLFDAIHANDFSAAKASVEAGAKVDTPGRWGMTAIELAVDKGYFKIAHYLVAVRNFQGGGGDGKTKGADGVPIAPAAGPGAASAGVSGSPSKAASPPPAPARPLDTMTQQPFYAPLTELEMAAGRGANNEGPSWPAGKPNPFDPEMPVVGSNLQVIGDIGSTDSVSSALASSDDPAAKTARPSDKNRKDTGLVRGAIGETPDFR